MPVTVIGDGAFSCSDINSIELQEGIVSIEYRALADCKQLEYVQLPRSFRKIGDYAFSGCVALENIDLPVGLETIGKFAFVRCDALRSLFIPETVKKIDDAAFAWCILDPLVIATTKVKAKSYRFNWSIGGWSVMYVNDYAMKEAGRYNRRVKNISEYRESTDTIDVEATIDLAIATSWDWDSLETKEDLLIKVIKTDRKNKTGMQRAAYGILGLVYKYRYELKDNYDYYSAARKYFNKAIELANIEFHERDEVRESAVELERENLVDLQGIHDERERVLAEQRASHRVVEDEDNGPGFLEIATQMIGVIGALSGNGTANNGSYSSGGTVSTGSSTTSSKTNKQTVTCSLCKGSGRSAHREYAFQAASKPKVWCDICGSKELQHVHHKLCTRCHGKGYVTK